MRTAYFTRHLYSSALRASPFGGAHPFNAQLILQESTSLLSISTATILINIPVLAIAMECAPQQQYISSRASVGGASDGGVVDLVISMLMVASSWCEEKEDANEGG